MKIKRFNELKLNFLDDIYNLRQFYQYEDIPYNKSCGCDCGYGNFLNLKTYNIIGYCDTNIGYQGVFECSRPECGEVYRHHVSDEKFDLDDFKEIIGMTLNRQSKIKALN
jgi:hypothetical protein